jgi:hypothetical protein
MSSRPGAKRIGAWVVLVALAATAGASLPLACDAPNDQPDVDQGSDTSIVIVEGPVFGVPSCCPSGHYVVVPAFACPRSTCSEVAYAVCRDHSYVGCSCTKPPGKPLPGAMCEAGVDSVSAGEGGCGEGGCSFDDGGDGANVAEAALFDVGDLGDCSGTTATKIAASECHRCKGAVAYALCNGMSFSSCSCVLPPGYVLVDGGILDAGSPIEASGG